MSEPKQAGFEGWAVVELFGHAKSIGFVTTEVFGTAVLFRVDTPELPTREYILPQPEYTTGDEELNGQKWTPAGAKVKRLASPACSRLIGPGAIYSIIPCTQLAAIQAIETLIRRPLILLELPPKTKPLELTWPETDAEEESEEGTIETERS